jgi:hypothetical protein
MAEDTCQFLKNMEAFNRLATLADYQILPSKTKYVVL